MLPLGERFGNSFQILTSLGRLTAILGFSLMATNIILAARFKWVEKLLKNLGQVYIKHHLIGSTAFILLLFHPLFLAIRLLSISVHSAALFLIPSLELWPQTLGIISLAIMIALMIITFYLGWRYQTWKFSHRFMTLAFVIGFFHVAFISSDVSQSFALRAYLLTLGGLALISYAYKLLVELNQESVYNNPNQNNQNQL
jgi:predicted ferric reductase